MLIMIMQKAQTKSEPNNFRQIKIEPSTALTVLEFTSLEE
jgi:hypothetical protein